MNIQTNIQINNKLAEDLSNMIQLVKDGKLSTIKASTINRLACTTIKATKEGVLMAHHQQIQRDKVIMHQKEIDVKYEHIQLQKDKLIKKKN
jgi:L-cystine uptake protein TcyP (sodium:dicarboxylate symporter family)|tara:strand:- start:1676 stop:1951 length:276 start_codon:yes stop_codon:yes gene_type:complete